jgi:hypothetical protein
MSPSVFTGNMQGGCGIKGATKEKTGRITVA